jgi:hypothetical protein
MPRIKPATDRQRQRYREQLAAGQRPAFDRLTGLVDAPRSDLRWYHAVGALVRELLPAAEKRRGKGALAGLAEALGPCPSLLQKAARFAQLYPSEKHLARLEQIGVDWTRLWLTFSIEDEKDREWLLREAVRGGWTSEQRRFEVQRRHPSRRLGVGGRPRAHPGAYGPEVTLRRLEQLSQNWLKFYQDAWLAVKPPVWKGLVRGWPKGDREKLRALLELADRALAGVATACEETRQTLAGLLRQVGPADRKPAQ